MSPTPGKMYKVCGYHHFVTKQLFLSGNAQCCNKECCECQLVRSPPTPILGQTIDRCITLTSSRTATGSSMSRLMAHFCLTQRILMPLFVTPAVRICRVRSLKERKYQLPVAIFDVRDVTFA